MTEISPKKEWNTEFSPSIFLETLYTKHYLKYLESIHIKDPEAPDYKYTNEWCDKPSTHKFVESNLNFMGSREQIEASKIRHYELLRLIMFESCDYTPNYIEFISDMLITLFETEGISLEYEVKPFGDLHQLLSIHQLVHLFKKKSDNLIKICNTNVYTHLRDINKDVCFGIKRHLKINQGYRRSKISKHTKHYRRSKYYKGRRSETYKREHKQQDISSDEDETRDSSTLEKEGEGYYIKKQKFKKTKKRKSKKSKKYNKSQK